MVAHPFCGQYSPNQEVPSQPTFSMKTWQEGQLHGGDACSLMDSSNGTMELFTWWFSPLSCGWAGAGLPPCSSLGIIRSVKPDLDTWPESSAHTQPDWTFFMEPLLGVWTNTLKGETIDSSCLPASLWRTQLTKPYSAPLLWARWKPRNSSPDGPSKHLLPCCPPRNRALPRLLSTFPERKENLMARPVLPPISNFLWHCQSEQQWEPWLMAFVHE